MLKFSLEINKTITKKDVRQKPLKDYYNSPNRLYNPSHPAILRSKSLPNSSEINFEQGTISAIVSPKNGKKFMTLSNIHVTFLDQMKKQKRQILKKIPS